MFSFESKFILTHVYSPPFVHRVDFEWVEIIPEPNPLAENASRKLSFTLGQRGCTLLQVDGFSFVKNRRGGHKTYWICSKKVYFKAK